MKSIGARRAFGRTAARIALLAAPLASTTVLAQDFPNKPIRMISPFPAGNVN